MLPALGKLCQKLYQDHLPGGRYVAEATDDVKKAAKGTAKHNKYCETVFALYDQILRTRPHISTIAAEASIMFTLNKTKEWLSAKGEEKEKEILKDARRGVSELRAQFKERQTVIRERKAEQLREKQQKAEDQRKKALNAKIKVSEEMVYWGLIQDEGDVDLQLQGLNKTEDKFDLLKAQIKFRRDVLEQKASDGKLFNFSKQVGEGRKRRQLTVSEMAENVKALIKESKLRAETHEEEGPSLVRKTVRHRFETDEGVKWWTGRVISCVRAFYSCAIQAEFNNKFKQSSTISSSRVQQ